MVRQIFSRLRGIPKEQLITSRYAKETAERKNHLQTLQAERDKAEKDLLALKTEILAVIKGESAFPKDTLAEMIAAQEKKHTELETLCEEASAELERNAELMANVSSTSSSSRMRNARIICKTFRHSGTRQKKTCWH